MDLSILGKLKSPQRTIEYFDTDSKYLFKVTVYSVNYFIGAII